MNRSKLVLLLIVLAVLVDFALENPLPRLELKLFRFTLGQLPTFLLAYISLALGLVAGLGRATCSGSERSGARPGQALAQEQQAKQTQPGQEAAA